jgi:hypothetical protein
MAYEENGLDISLPANTDLSAAQYKFVTVNSSGKIALTGLGEEPDGILQNAPAAADRPGRVRVAGVSKLDLGGSVTAGNAVVADTNGEGVAAGSADAYRAGKALETGVSGDVIPVLLKPTGLP